jgi:site-specific DNA-methyltransferase (cytosine-N4-specific)
MRALFAEVRRVLADDGTLWLNLGDSYSQTVTHSGAPAQSKTLGIRADGTDSLGDAGRARAQSRQRMAMPRKLAPNVGPKNLLGIPWRVAFALQDDGWILRSAIVWNKTNAMPESATDRLSRRHEALLLFSKARRYWFDVDAISEGANPGDVWSIPTQPFPEAHFAVMAPRLAERCVLAGCKPGGIVLDPFSGAGTTGMVAQRHGRKYVGVDLNAATLDLSLRTRLQQAALDFGGAA